MKISLKSTLKKALIIYGGFILILIASCTIVYITYTNKVKKTARESLLAAQKLTELVPNISDSETASTDISKTINEVLENEQIVENIPIDESQKETDQSIQNEQDMVQTNEEIPEETIVKELEFMYPVDGEIIKGYSVDNLVFSETLQEWTVHKGIDIKANRTSIVKAAEEGTVARIKTDPRYGLTVIVVHRDGFETVYSNLLTTEFVREGEEVQKGQSLGTVGNSASFEIADEPHLHFELLKDNENQDPISYLK